MWSEVSMIQKTIKSYLYFQYNDSEEVQAFVDAYNIMSQEYVDFFNSISSGWLKRFSDQLT